MVTSARIGFAVSIALCSGALYRFVVVEHNSAIGFWPLPIAIPALYAIICLGYYLTTRGPDKVDRLAGQILIWTCALGGVAGVLGY